MDLDLRKLRYFVTVAEELNFGRAADRLHIAQPVLSRQIAALEKELGVVLLTRSTRGTELSEAGRILLDDARNLLGQATSLQRRARVAARGRARLTIGFMPGVLVTGAVRRLREHFPDLEVEVLRTGWDDQLDVIGDGRADVSFVRLPVPSTEFALVELYDEPRLVALSESHPLLARPSLTITDLAGLDLLQPPDFHPDWRDAAARARPDALTTAREALPSAQTVEEKLEHVAAGRGIVLLPESTATYYHRPDVAYRYVEGLAPVTTALAYDPARTSPQISELVDIARELFARRSPDQTVTLASPEAAPRR